MKITWLGQAGLLFESAEGARVIIDPYLSDSVVKVNSQNYRRKPINGEFLKLIPDVLLFTHDHLDHYDPETAPIYFASKIPITVLCPCSVWQKARVYGVPHNYVQFDISTVWTEKGLRFTAVKAVHSDPYAIGVIIEELSSGRKYYITGDTLYNNEIFKYIPSDIYALFLPINGVGNNMNMADASEFAKRVGAKYTVPMHFGMFDELNPDGFICENKIVPEIYNEIKIPN